MLHIFCSIVSLIILFCTSAIAQANDCGTLYHDNKQCIRVAPGPIKRSMEGHPLQSTTFYTHVYNDCPVSVVVSVDWGDRQGESTIQGESRPHKIWCEDSPTCRNPDPKKRFPVSSHCCQRAPQVQSCRFLAKPRSDRSAGKAKTNPESKVTTRAPVKPADIKPPEPSVRQPPEPKLTGAERRDLELCFGDRQCIDIVMRDAAARAAREQKSADEKKAREDQEFLEFVKKEQARKQAKIHEEERMRKYHEEQNAAVAGEFLNGVTQILQGYVNSQSSNGGSTGGTTTGSTYKSLTTGGGSGASQCGSGPNSGCR